MTGKAILVLKTGEAPASVKAEYGDFEEWIARGLECAVEELEVARVYQGDALPAASDVGGVIITGSPAMVTERADWSEASARWLGALVREDATPVLGLCFGHQLLAHALGGEVGSNPNGREMGTFEVTFVGTAEDGDGQSVDGLAPLFERGAFPGHFSHLEAVLRPPPGARVLARTALDPHSAIEYGPRQWGVQCHPEFDIAILRRYVEARREVLVQEGLDPDAMIESATPTPMISRVMARFAEFVSNES
ncbi:MAG: glutamine amidotransferase [Deltaproteobacteria bacterium]|nr:glutamine amidotransferase [Deltaproteobacteria bacterium]